jgi:SAM-dependent methyltransferase
MSVPTDCRICSGPLVLRFRGAGSAAESQHLSPTNHRPGEHGDLFVCRHCGTVHQPSLPEGADLHELYRGVEDEAYLDEETGRRTTARRLLDLIGRNVPAGRLLDVGCGHGLLLDEARRRGYDVMGLELSASSAAYGREVLGLDVREQALDEFSDDEGFAVVVLADVIEHLDDPVAAIDHCQGLLAPGGVLCVVTPDPSSRTARLAGRRWWGYLPAHTYLLPRTTLRELLSARGLIISEDVPLVRSFALRYWVGGLAERSGGSAARAVGWLRRSRFGRATVSMSLGDERVVLAHRVEPIAPPEPRVTDRGGDQKVHIVLPAYNATRTIPLVAAAIPVQAADRALLVDDASPDETSTVALREGFHVLRHPANRGYGANQKTCYTRAAIDGADIVVMVHADNQYDPALVADMVRPIEEGFADVVIGSRLLEDETIAGGMPRWKWIGNRLLTGLENRGFRRRFSEYHTGYRAFSVDFLRSIPFHRNSDGFVFDQEIFAQIVARDARVVELAIPTRYFLEASSVSFLTSVNYGLRTLSVLARYRLDERRANWPLLRPPAARLSEPDRHLVAQPSHEDAEGGEDGE